jgi:molecular chaperone DnaK
VGGHNPILGIDLGTTNSVMAVVEGESPRIIPNAEGQNRTPSVVSYLPNGEIVVGEIARRQAATNLRGTIFSIKRLMGRPIDEIGDDLDFYTCPVIEHEGMAALEIGDEIHTPSEISSLILAKLKRDAEAHLNTEITQAIITVPAYFDDRQRQATIEAGRMAGLGVLRIINEPTAAAMAYGLGRKVEERIAVFDFGGGTFDLSILDVSENAFEVITSLGDSHLGGDDIDHAIVDMLLEDFHSKHGVDLGEDDLAIRRLKEAAEKSKCELSATTTSTITLPFIGQSPDGTPLHLEMTLTRDQIEDIVEPFVGRCLECCRAALADARLNVRDINRVILVGGSTRIPLVQAGVEDAFNLAPHRGVNPDEIVGLGAATQGGVMSGAIDEVILLEVTPFTLGIEVKGGRLSRIVEKNSSIPIKAEKTFTTTSENQALVDIHVLQGEGESTEEAVSLGKFSLTDISPAPAGVPRIKVTFTINADGVVEIEATDLASSQAKSLMILHTFDHRQRMVVGAESEEKKRRLRPNRWRERRQREPGRRANTLDTPAPEGGSSAPRRRSGVAEMDRSVNNTVDFTADSQSDDASGKPHRPRFGRPSDARRVHHTSRPAHRDSDTADQTMLTPLPEAGFGEAALEAAQNFLNVGADDTVAQSTYRNAIHLLEERLKQHVNDFRALQLLAELHLVTHNPHEARDCFQRLLSEGTASAAAIRAAYERHLGRRTHSVATHIDYAELLQQSGDVDTAIADLEGLPETDRRGPAVTKTLVGLYKQKIDEASDHETQFKLVKIHLQQNDLDAAIGLLQKLINDSAYSERAGKSLGLCFWQKHMLHLAWQRFRQLSLTDEVKDILYRLSQDLEAADDFTTAKQVLEHIFSSEIGYRDVGERLRSLDERARNARAESDPASNPLYSPLMAPESQIDDVRFTIVGEINRGSMGVVYKARDNVLDEIVALKVLNAFLCADPQAVERFKREARAAKRLSHPNIVRIHDMFEKGNKKFLSMEYIAGSDLKSILKTQGRMEASDIIRIVEGICLALAYGHKLDIVHRDIKPANIMITEAKRQVKITDYGIAKVLDNDKSGTGTMVMGTPLYMAPEQVEGGSIDARTDLYSLGVLMYELSSGKPPFTDGNIEYQHVNSDPEKPKHCPPGLCDVIMRCLEKDPGQRFQSAEELIAQLKGLELAVSDTDAADEAS